MPATAISLDGKKVFSEVNGTSIYILYPPVVWIPAQMVKQIYLF